MVILVIKHQTNAGKHTKASVMAIPGSNKRNIVENNAIIEKRSAASATRLPLFWFLKVSPMTSIETTIKMKNAADERKCCRIMVSGNNPIPIKVRELILKR